MRRNGKKKNGGERFIICTATIIQALRAFQAEMKKRRMERKDEWCFMSYGSVKRRYPPTDIS